MTTATDMDASSACSENIPHDSMSSLPESNKNENEEDFERKNIPINNEPEKVVINETALRTEKFISFEDDANSGNSQNNSDECQSQIEPEGTIPDHLRKASRRFDDGMLQKVISGEEQDNNGTTVQTTTDTSTTKDFDKMLMQEKNEDEDEKSMEPPGSPAKVSFEEKSTTETTSGEGGKEIIDANKIESNEIKTIEERNDEMKINGEQIIHREPSGTSTTMSTGEYIDQSKETSKSSQEEKKTDEERPIRITGIVQEEEETPLEPHQPIISELNINRTTPNTSSRRVLYTQPKIAVRTSTPTSNEELSPNDIEVDSADPTGFRHSTLNGQLENGIPLQHPELGIPHLPPLMAPITGSSHTAMHGPDHSNGYHQYPHRSSVSSIPNQVTTMPAPGGKRKIHLRLLEDVSSIMQPEKSGFLSFRRNKGILRSPMHSSSISEFGANKSGSRDPSWVDRGSLTVSWYEGTSSVELQEHVRNSIIRKLGIRCTTKLLDFRVLDESTDPPEEIVLSTYIPNGSRLLLRFATANDEGETTPPKYTRFSDFNSPPDSPSAAPSPYPSNLDLNGLGLNANQLALLGTRLNGMQIVGADLNNQIKSQQIGRKSNLSKSSKKKSSKDEDDEDEDDGNSKSSNMEVASLHPEDPVQKSLREITGLLLAERKGEIRQQPRQEKRQVIFVLANYFVLFLSLLAISAEIQARAPGWHTAMEQQLKNVHDCSKDKESLFQCVENGDMAGLVASVVLWISRSAATKRIFLLGFESPKRLWTAVYESLVTAFCWGFSYIVIRRGMNPDNKRDFLRRYWKDAVYGSLAGFNAAFMKQVLKNLIPQEVIEDALQDRQLKILSWLHLPSIG